MTAEETFTVVIDAGHGGKDAGAINGKNQEKNIDELHEQEAGVKKPRTYRKQARIQEPYPHQEDDQAHPQPAQERLR